MGTLAAVAAACAASPQPVSTPPSLVKATSAASTAKPTPARGRLHACRFCTYTSPSSYAVQVHERTHTGERPFGCMFCPYRAAQKKTVLAHERSIHQQAHPAAGDRRANAPPAGGDTAGSGSGSDSGDGNAGSSGSDVCGGTDHRGSPVDGTAVTVTPTASFRPSQLASTSSPSAGTSEASNGVCGSTQDQLVDTKSSVLVAVVDGVTSSRPTRPNGEAKVARAARQGKPAATREGATVATAMATGSLSGVCPSESSSLPQSERGAVVASAGAGEGVGGVVRQGGLKPCQRDFASAAIGTPQGGVATGHLASPKRARVAREDDGTCSSGLLPAVALTVTA